jgi:hypothetical protein
MECRVAAMEHDIARQLAGSDRRQYRPRDAGNRDQHASTMRKRCVSIVGCFQTGVTKSQHVQRARWRWLKSLTAMAVPTVTGVRDALIGATVQGDNGGTT